MMKYLLQKTTVLILAVCMILSCIVLPVSAEETQYAEQEAAEEIAVTEADIDETTKEPVIEAIEEETTIEATTEEETTEEVPTEEETTTEEAAEEATTEEETTIEEPTEEETTEEETTEEETTEEETTEEETTQEETAEEETIGELLEEAAEEPQTEPETEEISEEELPAFFGNAQVEGVLVSVSAPEGVFPADAVLSVQSVPASVRQNVESLIDSVRREDEVVAVSYTLDIKVLDGAGEELQPKDGQKVTVSFSAEEAQDSNLKAQIYHISDAGFVQEMDTGVLYEEETIGIDGCAVYAETDSFSYYTVEFTYHKLQYILESGSSIRLSDILEELGLTGEVTDVQCSNEELFSAVQEDGIWMLTSHKDFTSEEWLKVTINQIEYEILVTDDTTVTVEEIKLTTAVTGETVTYTGQVSYTLAYEVLTLVNQERAKEGLSALVMDQDLLEAAMLRAGEIAVSFSHTRPDGSSCFSACSKMSGENIAAGSSTAAGTMNQWMNSEGHRANILGGYRSIGVGCFIINGNYYWVQCFGGGVAETATQLPDQDLVVNAQIRQDLLGTAVLRFDLAEGTHLDDETFKLNARFYLTDEDDGTFGSIPIADTNLTWASSKKTVAKVSSSGWVTTLKPGTATITAKLGTTFTASYVMTVTCHHQFSDYTLNSSNQFTAVCSRCGKTITGQAPTEYSLVWRNSISEDGYFYSGFPLNNPIGSNIECWFYYTDGEDGFNQMIIENSNQAVLETPARISSGIYNFKIKKAGTVVLHFYMEYNPSLGFELVLNFSKSGMWMRQENGWCFFKDGLPVTGWQKIDGTWYYFDSSGYMQTGWKKIGSKWFYFASNGAMQTGWQQISKKWYYFNGSGVMQTGWLNKSSKWYYLESSGEMVTGWKKISSKWYYFESSGSMVTGWKRINRKWYYFLSGGAMVTGTRKIDGKTYTFNASGVLIG